MRTIIHQLSDLEYSPKDQRKHTRNNFKQYVKLLGKTPLDGLPDVVVLNGDLVYQNQQDLSLIHI